MESIGSFEDINTLYEWEDNPRHNEIAIDKVAQSIKRFGFASPLIVRKEDRKIICGNTRFLAAKKIGLTQVPVRFLDIDPVEARLLAIADNKIGELADWNNELLSEILQQHQEEDLFDLGFTDQELNSLLKIDLETTEYSTSENKELDLSDFEDFDHKCPRCNFEWSE